MKHGLLCLLTSICSVPRLSLFSSKRWQPLTFPLLGAYISLIRPLTSRKKVPLQDERFCIGPSCSPIFWNTSPGKLELYGEPSVDCGPCELPHLLFSELYAHRTMRLMV